MTHLLHRLLPVIAVLAALPQLSHAAESGSASLSERAEKLYEQKPSAWRLLGLAEIRRAAGSKAGYPSSPPTQQNAAPNYPAVMEALGWRAMPVGVAETSRPKEIASEMGRVGSKSPWIHVFNLYAASVDNNRPALIVAAGKLVDAPAAFPSETAEKAHLDLLKELGVDDNQAALEVLSHRSYAPLHALLELDQALTRDIDFLKGTTRAADAKTLEAARDKLRQAYLDNSRHLVERLFALHLLGRKQDCDALLFAARELPYLTDPAELSRTLAKLSVEDARTLLIEPLLAGEVRVIQSPPKLPAAPATSATELTIASKNKTVREGISTYEGAVRIKAKGLEITCDQLAVVAGAAGKDPAEKPPAKLLSGAGQVTIKGAPGFARIQAEHLTFDLDTGAFSLGGDVRLTRGEQTLKFRACTLSRTGELRDTVSLLDDFDAAPDVRTKLALLPRLSATYTDEELPVSARYLLAMHLLRPQLVWHEQYAPPVREDKSRLERAKVQYQRADRRWTEDLRWGEAHTGEPWMRQDAADQLQASRRDALKNDKVDALLLHELPADFFWTLKDPASPAVARAQKLLASITASNLAEDAHRWKEALARNNTVFTMDVAGGYKADQAAPVVLDARAADRISFSLYRVRSSQTLAAAASHIGEDFMFRDYGLQSPVERLAIQDHIMQQSRKQLDRLRALDHRLPVTLDPKDLVGEWEARVADLPLLSAHHLRHEWAEDPWDEDSESQRYDDRCEYFRERIDKRYRAEDRASSWRTDRIVQIPAKFLKEPGAYLLVARPQNTPVDAVTRAIAPILVEPLSMTLGRSRDGVIAAVSSPDSAKPAAFATLLAPGVPMTTADAQGVAFVRTYASGERTIIAEHQGRFAIGGFGDLFEGIYLTAEADRYWNRRLRVARQMMQQMRVDQPLAGVYEDRHVLAAYTDRPTYRPGQQVQFKIIARLAEQAPAPKAGGDSFRSEDYDLAAHLKLLPTGTRLRWTAVDAKNRAAAAGDLELNDFGTAAAGFKLPDSAVVGAYALRIAIGGMNREIPAAFAVKYYRRPNFELSLDDVATTAKPGDTLHPRLKGQYYFGKPVAGGTIELRLVASEQWRPVATEKLALDSAGVASAGFAVPETLSPGKYQFIATLTDESHLAVSKSVAVEIAAPQNLAVAGAIARLPAFAAVGTSVDVSSTAPIRIMHHGEKSSTIAEPIHIAGRTQLLLREAGWYSITAGPQRTWLFAYQPTNHQHPLNQEAAAINDDDASIRPRWVNLTDYSYGSEGDGDDESPSRWSTPDQQVWALFSRQHAAAGESLPVLVYTATPRARLLFTFEGRTVADYHLASIDAPGHYHVVNIPIRARHTPNVYLRARVIGSIISKIAEPRVEVPQYERKRKLQEAKQVESDESEDPRWCRIDVTDPAAAPAGEKLKITLATDKAEYQPGDLVSVSAKVTDRAGNPRQTEISLAVIDQSVFTFGEFSPASVAGTFASPAAPRRYLDKSWRRSIGESGYTAERQQRARDLMQKAQQMAQAMAELQKSSQQLDAAANPDAAPPLPLLPPLPALPQAAPGQLPVAQFPLAPRMDFRETAAWLPQLRTDEAGLLNTTFKLPDSLTAYRLTAIGLTRETEIGHAVATLRARKLLSVQLQLPRFAVEGDQLEATALIHNTTDRVLTATITWKAAGATLSQNAPPSPQGENTAGQAEKASPPVGKGGGEGPERKEGIVIRTLTLKPHSTSATHLPLSFTTIGRAQLTLSVTAGELSDSEQRSVPVLPLGRPAEFRVSGTFTKEHTLSLPKDFFAHDVTISMARGDIAHALDGLGYLIDYPYGCAEQTMSRFLPAVIVRNAMRDLPIELPPDVAAKLPDVIKQGLARLYHFQHEDGGWGWWEKDASDDRMTIYVLSGLARCKLADVDVDPAIIERGVARLQSRLPSLEPLLLAQAHLALALAGKADKPALAAYALWVTKMVSPYSPKYSPNQPAQFAILAQATHAAGLPDSTRGLAALLTDWSPADAYGLSLKLSVQLATGKDPAAARATASSLLLLRKGHRWDSTQSTAQAIGALAELLHHTNTDSPPAASAAITVSGQSATSFATKEDLSKLVYRAHLTSALSISPTSKTITPTLPHTPALPITLRCDTPDPLHFAVTATGYQKLDHAPPTGDSVRLTRQYTTLDGHPLVTPVKPGDVIACQLTLTLTAPQDYLMIEDYRPSLCEYADDRLQGLVAPLAGNTEFRDDRFCTFFTHLPAGQHRLTYFLRAQSKGQSQTLPGRAGPMYNEALQGETGITRLEVR